MPPPKSSAEAIAFPQAREPSWGKVLLQAPPSRARNQQFFGVCPPGGRWTVLLHICRDLPSNFFFLVSAPNHLFLGSLWEAHRALCLRCAKSRLFSITGSHGSQGPKLCPPPPPPMLF